MTPYLQQCLAIKKQNPDSIHIFRKGGFYECFGSDAEVVAKLLELTVTSMSKKDKSVPMCAFPYWCIGSYQEVLERDGHSVILHEE